MVPRPFATILVILMVVLAGCAGGTSINDGTTATPEGDAAADSESGSDSGGTDGSATLDFYLSDERNAIDDFEHLNVTIVKVGVHRTGGADGDREESDGGDAGDSGEESTADAEANASAEADGETNATADGNSTDANATVEANATLDAEASAGDGGNETTGDDGNETAGDGNETAGDDADSEESAGDESDGDEADDGSPDARWVEHEVENVTLDLTELQGARAAQIGSFALEPGEYDKTFVYVGSVEGTLKSGEEVNVKLPSDKLHIKKGFTVGDGQRANFVFDITVVEAGNSGKYVIKPVVSETGTDEEVEIEDVTDEVAPDLAEERSSAGDRAGSGDEAAGGGNETADGADAAENDETEGADDDAESDDGDREAGDDLAAEFKGDVRAGAEATLRVTADGEPVEGAAVTANGEAVGETDADGRLAVPVPDDAEEIEVVVERGDAELELTETVRGEGDGSADADGTNGDLAVPLAVA